MSTYIEKEVDKWYGTHKGILNWKDRQTLIKVIADCSIAAVIDSAILKEAEQISLDPLDIYK